MVPRLLIDSASVPGGGAPLRLMRRGQDYTIMLGGNELMSSRTTGSEEALATLAFAAMRPRANARVLIGGLGMGFTLRAALGAAAPDAKIVVVELVPEVVRWAKGPLAALNGDCLADPRVDIVVADVADWVARGRGSWDAILLDVDNGPDGLSRAGNERLYHHAGLRAAWAALAPGGVIALWSAAPDVRFAPRLTRAGFAVEEHAVRGGKAQRGPRHVIWIATKR